VMKGQQVKADSQKGQELLPRLGRG